MAPQVQYSGKAGARALPDRTGRPPSGLALRIEGVGVQALPGGRRVGVAVDLSRCREGSPEWAGDGSPPCPRLELALESPMGRHAGSAALVECRGCTVDLLMHVHGDPEPGEYTLHVGLFWGEQLLQHERHTFRLSVAARSEPAG